MVGVYPQISAGIIYIYIHIHACIWFIWYKYDNIYICIILKNWGDLFYSPKRISMSTSAHLLPEDQRLELTGGESDEATRRQGQRSTRRCRFRGRAWLDDTWELGVAPWKAPYLRVGLEQKGVLCGDKVVCYIIYIYIVIYDFLSSNNPAKVPTHDCS